MNVKDKILRIHETVVSERMPCDINVMWIRKNFDSTYTFFINDGIDWITPQSSNAEGTHLSDSQLDAIRRADKIIVDGGGVRFLSDNGTYKPIESFLKDYARISDIPINVSQLSNDKGYLTEHQSLEKYYTKSDIDAIIKKTTMATDYALLDNKPSVGGVVLEGDRTLAELGLYSREEADERFVIRVRDCNDDFSDDFEN